MYMEYHYCKSKGNGAFVWKLCKIQTPDLTRFIVKIISIPDELFSETAAGCAAPYLVKIYMMFPLVL